MLIISKPKKDLKLKVKQNSHHIHGGDGPWDTWWSRKRRPNQCLHHSVLSNSCASADPPMATSSPPSTISHPPTFLFTDKYKCLSLYISNAYVYIIVWKCRNGDRSGRREKRRRLKRILSGFLNFAVIVYSLSPLSPEAGEEQMRVEYSGVHIL